MSTCGHGTPACAMCERSRRDFSDFLDEGHNHDEIVEWLRTYNQRRGNELERQHEVWSRRGC